MANGILTPEAVRLELPLTQKVAYFQTGTHGLTPDSVTQRVAETLRYINHHGLSIPATRATLEQQEASAKQKLADFLHISTAELAWAANTSQALHKVLHAVRWQPGDEFIVTSAEHVSVQGACQALERDYGVVVRVIEATKGEDVLLAELEGVITGRSRLLCISQVSTMDGRRLPVAKAAAIAKEKGVLVLADVAQSVGQMVVDLAALNCHFAIGSLHKWMLGTKGLGFLYINKDAIGNFIPDFIPDYHPWSKPDDPRPPIDAKSRAEQGTHSFAIRIGVERTIDLLNQLTIHQIEAHGLTLANHFCDAIAAWQHVNLVSPQARSERTGLICINFNERDDAAVRKLITLLLENNIVAKYQPEPNGIRFSFSIFNTLKEVDWLLEVLQHAISHID